MTYNGGLETPKHLLRKFTTESPSSPSQLMLHSQGGVHIDKTMDVQVADGLKMKKPDTSTALNSRPQN